MVQKGQIKLPLLLLPHYAGFSETHMALQKRTFYTSIIVSVVLVWRALAEALVETGLEGIMASVQGLLLAIPEPLCKLEKCTLHC